MTERVGTMLACVHIYPNVAVFVPHECNRVRMQDICDGTIRVLPRGYGSGVFQQQTLNTKQVCILISRFVSTIGTSNARMFT